MKRRTFIKQSSVCASLSMFLLAQQSCKGKIAGSNNVLSTESVTDGWKLSLAQWSFHRALQNGDMDHLDFAAKAAELGFEGVEYVNQFFAKEVENLQYLSEMKMRADEAGVEQLLIMVDGEGDLASSENKLRKEAVENHKKWVDAAKYLACHSVRVNLFGEMGNKQKWIANATNALTELAAYAAQDEMNIIVENHGWFSSDAAALAMVMRQVDKSNCGTLPDFGNFCTKRSDGQLWGGDCLESYDRYKGVEELLPFAKAVSAKSYDFDENGNETTIDFTQMMNLLKSNKYKGYIGVEYEGSRLSEQDGITATKTLLEKHMT